MDILIRFGFTIEEIKNMMDTNINIDNLDEKNIERLIIILTENNCSKKEIKNILISNPLYLNRSEKEITDLIKALKGFNINNLQTLFDSNPFILNLDKEELQFLIKTKISEGLTNEEVIDFICYELI